jgi:hypothetical protein
MPAFHWFHLREANEPFLRRDGELPRLAPRAARFSQALPYRYRAWRLLTYADPNMPLPAEEREVAWELFCHEVAWADRQVGVILDALRNSALWENAWVILTASQGMELGEHSQMLYAQNLGRKSIEVPLMIRLPRSLRGDLAVPDDIRVSQLRLWATLVESAAGGRNRVTHRACFATRHHRYFRSSTPVMGPTNFPFSTATCSYCGPHDSLPRSRSSILPSWRREAASHHSLSPLTGSSTVWSSLSATSCRSQAKAPTPFRGCASSAGPRPESRLLTILLWRKVRRLCSDSDGCDTSIGKGLHEKNRR